MGYTKPTLFEILAEVHMEPGQLTESRFFEIVPLFKDLGFTDIELGSGGFVFNFEPGQPSSWPKEKQRVRCWKPGKRELAQVAEDLFVLNLTGGDYPGWDHFLGLFRETTNAVRAGIGGLPVQSLKLHTIDRFQVARNGFTVSEYLDVGGGIIPSWYKDCDASADVNLGKGYLQVDGWNRSVNVGIRANTDPVGIDIQAIFHESVDPTDDLMKLLDQLHDDSNKTFESLITNRVRKEIMGGLKA